jgi:hypothetical protein
MAIEIVDFPIQIDDFPLLMLVYRRVHTGTKTHLANAGGLGSKIPKSEYVPSFNCPAK